VFAHEFGHVEQAEEPDISRLYNWMNVQGERLRQAEGSFGVGKYSALPWTGPLQYELDQLGLALEKSAD
jgi:hypothetical protein